MSLAAKYTWSDFLKAHPEQKKKKLKRTSPEGEKAFKAAFKTFAKEHLKDRGTFLKKEEERVTKSKTVLVTALKEIDGKKWHLKAKKLNTKIGRFDAYLAKLSKWHEESKQLAKKI